MPRGELGDIVESALSSVGVTSDWVESWLGVPCNCLERKQKLNQLSSWAKMTVKGKLGNAKKYLVDLVRSYE